MEIYKKKKMFWLRRCNIIQRNYAHARSLVLFSKRERVGCSREGGNILTAESERGDWPDVGRTSFRFTSVEWKTPSRVYVILRATLITLSPLCNFCRISRTLRVIMRKWVKLIFIFNVRDPLAIAIYCAQLYRNVGAIKTTCADLFPVEEPRFFCVRRNWPVGRPRWIQRVPRSNRRSG